MERYHKTPNTLAVLSYDATWILLQAVEEAGIDDLEVIPGNFHFDDQHKAVKLAPMLHLVDGELVDIQTVDAKF